MIQSFTSRLEFMLLYTLRLIRLMKNKYHIKIVSYDPVKYDLQSYPLGERVSFTVGYLVQQNNKITHTAWFTNRKALFRHLDKFLNKKQS